MAKEAIEYHFTPIPNDALERLAEADGLTGREFRILLVVIRKTWGWSKERDRIPMSQFSKATGIDRRKCHVLLTSLIDKRIIKKTVTLKGDRKSITYSFNVIYSEWKLSPSRGTKAINKIVPVDGHRVSPFTGTNLSPSTAHSIDTKRNIEKESGEDPFGAPAGLQDLSFTSDGAVSGSGRTLEEEQAAKAFFTNLRSIGVM